MTREILVQDLPPQLVDMKDLPSDWEPGILCSRQDVLQTLQELGLDADRLRPERVRIELGPGRFLEFVLGPQELMPAFEIRMGDSPEEIRLADAVLRKLGFRALDPSSPSGLFAPAPERSRMA